jgi:hypothetical protein
MLRSSCNCEARNNPNSVWAAKWCVLAILIFAHNALAESRNFRMALWNNPSGADADLPVFSEGEAQPGGSSILLISSWRIDDFARHWADAAAKSKYNLSRIEAVIVDEPYWNALGTPKSFNACANTRNVSLLTAERQLSSVAFVLKQSSPQIKFWVNFSEPELQWMMDTNCPAALIQPYMDVVSVDIYWKGFSSVKPYYDWLIRHRVLPSQQIALVPGTFYRDGKDEQVQQANYLRGYFDYAELLNKECGSSSGPRGAKFKSDRCIVWIVMGWLRQTWRDPNGTLWRGEGDPSSVFIRCVWQAKQKAPVTHH